MLNFIFSPDWRVPSLILLVVNILMMIYKALFSDDYDVDLNEVGTMFWASVVLWAIIPIAMPILVLANIVLFSDIEEFIEGILSKDDKEKSGSHKNTNVDESSESKKRMIQKKIAKIVELAIEKKMITKSDYSRDDVDFKYASYEYLRLVPYAYESLRTVIASMHQFTEDNAYKTVHSTIYDILTGVADYYISVLSDTVLSKETCIRMIREFNQSVEPILNEVVSGQTKIIEENKRIEEELRVAKIKELSKISMDKLTEAKDSMIDTFNIIAGVKKK